MLTALYSCQVVGEHSGFSRGAYYGLFYRFVYCGNLHVEDFCLFEGLGVLPDRTTPGDVLDPRPSES